MSEAVPSAKVEDVLSSIRRLVSSADEAGADAPGGPQRDRLVLTQALRITGDEPFGTAATPDTFVLHNAILPEDAVTASEDHVKPAQIPPVVEEPPQNPEKSAAMTLSAKIAALETAIGNISGQWEPDTPGEDDYSGTQAPALTWRENVELDATGRPIGKKSPEAEQATATERGQQETVSATMPDPEPQTMEPESEPNDAEADADADILDEETLRALVADIVRAELQGELGERITRNVRKLVRREIHRALTAKDFE